MKDTEFCPKCGAKLEADERFCGKCGFDTESLEQESLVSEEPLQPNQMAVSTIPLPPKTSSSGSQKIVIIILAVIFENNVSGTWKWTDSGGFTLYYQFSNGMFTVTDGGSDYYYDSYTSTVTTGTNGTIGTIYIGGDQLYIDCNPLGDNAIYINGYLCTYVP